MPPEGENTGEHLAAKTVATAAQIEDKRRNLTAIAAEADLDFRLDRETRAWNSFDGRRLVYWAEKAGDPLLLKTALFKANFRKGRRVSNHEVLADIAVECGLDGARARESLSPRPISMKSTCA